MTTNLFLPAADALSDPRVADAVAAFQTAIDAGDRPDRAAYVARHPDVAVALDGCLRMIEFVRGAVSSRTSPSPSPSGEANSTSISPGVVLGEFRVVREVGRGGMGVVYEAVQEPLGRTVALKVLPGGSRGNPQALARFRREAETAARLHHTNIVPVFAVGDSRGVSYFAMQFIDGTSLTAAADAGGDTATHAGSTDATPAPAATTGPVPSADRLRVTLERIVQAADALAYAHGQGVLHRDVKPSNLLVDSSGHVWVADFGLAKAGESDDLTATGDLVGTLRYMAPERFSGQCDARADVYGLGATLYELVTGRPVFGQSGRPELIDAITRRQLVSPRSVVPGLGRDLETVILKAVAGDPADRYQSAGAFATDLRNLLADRPPAARRPGPVEQVVRWARRNRRVAALLAVTFALLSVIAVGGTVQTRSLRSALKDADDALISEKQALVEKGIALAEKSQALAAETNALAQSREQERRAFTNEATAWLAGDRAEAREGALAALSAAARLKPDPALRRDVVAALVKPAYVPTPDFDPRTVFRTGELTFPARLQNRPDRVTFFTEPDQLEVGHLVTDETFSHANSVSPCGRYFVTYPNRQPRGTIWSRESGQPVARVEIPLSMISWTSDGSRFAAVAMASKKLCVVELPSGVVVRSEDLPGRPSGVALNPRGTLVAVAYQVERGGQYVRVAGARADGKTVHEFSLGSSPVAHVRWGDSGRTLAAATRANAVTIWTADDFSLPNGIRETQTISTPDAVQSLAFDPFDRTLHVRTAKELLQVDLFDYRIRTRLPVDSGERAQTLKRVDPQNVSPLVRDVAVTGPIRTGDPLGLTVDATGTWLFSNGVPVRVTQGLSLEIGDAGARDFSTYLSPDSKSLTAFHATSGEWQRWDLAGMTLSAKGHFPPGSIYLGYRGPNDAVLKENRTIVTRAWETSADGTRTYSRLVRDEIPLPAELPTTGLVSLRWDDATQTVYAIVGDRTHLLWWPIRDPGTCRGVSGPAVESIATDPVGGYVYAAGGSGGRATTGTNIAKAILSRGPGSIRRYRLADGTNVSSFPTDAPAFTRIWVSADGRTVAKNVPAGYSVTDATNGTPVWDVKKTGGLTGNAFGFHPRGQYVALDMGGGRVELRRASDGTVLLAFPPFKSAVNNLDFTADGRCLVVGERVRKTIYDLTTLRAELRKLNLDWDDDPPSGQAN